MSHAGKSSQQGSAPAPQGTHVVPSQSSRVPQRLPSQQGWLSEPQSVRVSQTPPMHTSIPVQEGQHAPAGHSQTESTQPIPSVHAGQHAPAGQTHAPSSQTSPSKHPGTHPGPPSPRS